MGRILGWFFDGFSYFCPKSRFCKNHCFSIGKLLFSRVRACENQSKIQPKTMQISYGKIRSKKNSRNGFGTVLAFIWEGVGTLWGVFWSLLGASWPFWGVQDRAFVKHESEMGSTKASGSIFGRFCGGFGRIPGRFAKVLGRFGSILAWILEQFGGESAGTLTTLKKAGAESLNRTPVLLREASQCAGSP